MDLTFACPNHGAMDLSMLYDMLMLCRSWGRLPIELNLLWLRLISLTLGPVGKLGNFERPLPEKLITLEHCII
jgi:hypothetical protein